MALRVRFPDGTVVTYNSANHLTYSPTCWNLLTEKDGGWVASIQPEAGVIVEFVPACRVDNPFRQEAIEYVAQHIREFDAFRHSSALRTLKRELASYLPRERRWKSVSKS